MKYKKRVVPDQIVEILDTMPIQLIVQFLKNMYKYCLYFYKVTYNVLTTPRLIYTVVYLLARCPTTLSGISWPPKRCVAI